MDLEQLPNSHINVVFILELYENCVIQNLKYILSWNKIWIVGILLNDLDLLIAVMHIKKKDEFT